MADKPKGVMGRPRIEINYEQLAKLIEIQANKREIAGWFDVSEDTIERCIKRDKGLTYAEFYSQKSARGLISLRRKMFQLALDGNVTMLIWLSKQHLQMSEKHTVQTDLSTRDDKLVINFARHQKVKQTIIKEMDASTVDIKRVASKEITKK